MANATTVPRYWMTIEQEEVLREMGIADPCRDDIPAETLDALEVCMNAAESDWEREEFRLLLRKLEEEL